MNRISKKRFIYRCKKYHFYIKKLVVTKVAMLGIIAMKTDIKRTTTCENKPSRHFVQHLQGLIARVRANVSKALGGNTPPPARTLPALATQGATPHRRLPSSY